MRWAAPNRRDVPISLCLLLAVFVLAWTAAAQTPSDISSEYRITTFEGPQGASFGIADGTLLFLRKNELIRVDPEGTQLTPLPIDEIEARSWTWGGGSAWIVGKSKNFWGIHRLDLQTGKLIDMIALEHNRDDVISYVYGSLWISPAFVLAKGKPLLRIDPQTKQVTTIDVGQGFKGQLAVSDGRVWLLGVEDGSVKCLDPQSNKVIDEFSVGREHDNGILKGAFKGGSYSYGIGDGMLWVGDTQGINGGRYVLSGFDLKTHERIAQLESDAGLWGPVIWNGYVWLSMRGDPRTGHYISRIDPKLGHTTGRIFVPASPGGREANFLPPIVLTGEDSLWALSSNPWSKKTPVIIRRIQVKHANGVGEH